MNENEAIQKLDSLHYKIIHTSFCNKVYESEIEALCIAKDVLEEIQRYREFGTTEEIKKAMEKNRAKKPFIQRTYEKTLYKCPCCKRVFVEAYADLQRGYIPKYCEMCGQSIDF